MDILDDDVAVASGKAKALALENTSAPNSDNALIGAYTDR